MSTASLRGSLNVDSPMETVKLVRLMVLALGVSWSSHSRAQAVQPVEQASESEAAEPGKGVAADAQPTVEQCLDAHRECQQAQNENDLLVAHRWATTCSRLACPGMLVTDCVRWLNDLDLRIPSVVFDVRLDGVVHPSAKIEIDGTPLGGWKPGEPMQILPGRHRFRFVVESRQPIEQTMLLSEGVRYRVVSIDFKTPAPAAPPPQPAAPEMVPLPKAPPQHARPVPVLVYPLLGLGAIGVGGFAGFALAGQSEFERLRDSCAPNCTDDDVSKARSRFLIGNISLGIGAAALVGAGVLYFTRPDQVTSPAVGFDAIPNGGMATLRIRGF